MLGRGGGVSLSACLRPGVSNGLHGDHRLLGHLGFLGNNRLPWNGGLLWNLGFILIRKHL